MITDTMKAGLAALPCPAVFLGSEPWLNKEMKALVSSEEAKRLFSGEKNARFVMLDGRRFALMRSEEDTRILLLIEQFARAEEDPSADALEMRLRNALACSVLAARLLERETPEGRGKSYLAELRKNMAQIEHVCDNLHTVNLKENRTLRTCDIARMVRELYDKANYYLPEGKKVGYRIEEGEADICCAPSLMESMLLNLTVELLAHGDKEGHVSLTIVPGDRLTISFTAEHIGAFSKELESMLFAREGEGTGFEAVRRAVEFHKGSLYVRAQGTDGAVVTVVIPKGRPALQVWQTEGKYRGYDYVRMMLSDVLDRDAFLEGRGKG